MVVVNPDAVAIEVEKIPAKSTAYVYREARIETPEVPAVGRLYVQKLFPPDALLPKKPG